MDVQVKDLLQTIGELTVENRWLRAELDKAQSVKNGSLDQTREMDILPKK